MKALFFPRQKSIPCALPEKRTAQHSTASSWAGCGVAALPPLPICGALRRAPLSLAPTSHPHFPSPPPHPPTPLHPTPAGGCSVRQLGGQGTGSTTTMTTRCVLCMLCCACGVPCCQCAATCPRLPCARPGPVLRCRHVSLCAWAGVPAAARAEEGGGGFGPWPALLCSASQVAWTILRGLSQLDLWMAWQPCTPPHPTP